VFDSDRITHQLLRELIHEVRKLRHELRSHKATFATLRFYDSEGRILMPATLSVGQTATAVLHEFVSQGGAELAPIGPVSYASSDPTIATVDPTSGLVTAVAAGTATITGTDAGNSLSASDSVSDQPLTATVATLVITPN
jgi:Bacterial Ig-like domain (group 2)